MKPAAFDFVRPGSLDEALTILARADGAARPIAGGQSLGPMLNLRLARPGLLVDISRLPELLAVEDRRESWLVGAATTHAVLEDGATAVGTGMVSEVARGIAYRAVRNRGTIGGSLAHADSAADWPLALTAMGATAHVAGVTGMRRVPVSSLIRGMFETVLDDAELIIAVEIPKGSAAMRWGYYKFCRKIGEFPDASAAVVLDPDRGWAAAAIGAVSGPPRLLPDVSELLRARSSPDGLSDAVGAAAPELDDLGRHLHARALNRAFTQACG